MIKENGDRDKNYHSDKEKRNICDHGGYSLFAHRLRRDEPEKDHEKFAA